MWSLSPRTVVAHTRCNTYLQGKYSGQSFRQVQTVKLFTFQLCLLTADVADNHRRVGKCCESWEEMQEISENRTWHVEEVRRKMCPLYLPAELSVLICGDIYYIFWFTSRNLGENSLKTKCYSSSLWVGMERPKLFSVKGQPRKRQPCTEVPLCLNTGDPQNDSSKQSSFVLMPLLFSYKATISQTKKCLKVRHLNYLIMFFSLKTWAK